MVNLEDKLLVSGFLLTHSETVFSRLYQKHTTPLFKMAVQLANGNTHAAEEIVQETWIRAVAKLQGFTWQSSFKTWLTGITINCAREYNRQAQPTYNLETAEDETVQVDTTIKLDLQRALAMLPAGYREILVLHDMQGFKHKEISQLLDITEGTSKSQLFNARKTLQKLLH